MVDLSASVSPPGRSKTTVVGRDSRPVNRKKSSSTVVDSALCGRKEALSFFCTSASRPANDPSGPPMNSHTSTTRSGKVQRLDRDRWRGDECDMAAFLEEGRPAGPDSQVSDCPARAVTRQSKGIETALVS